jgi:glycosyltransferase involved in cell wall biosynthesis
VPQQEQWLASFADADAVLTYSDWGLKVLNSEGGGLIRTRGSAPPGVDTEVFRPFDKQDVRNSLGFDDSPMFIVGTCMRNQGRKLYPNLIADFAKFLDEAPEDISSKSYLYLHVSYPDVGWDIPNLIKNSGISDRILVTYKCQKCHAVVPNLYSDASLTCPACGSHRSMGLPNLKRGVDRATLAAIMNLFDAYVQYAVCEGFGVPQIEAAACGVPVFSVDYSAMEDVVRKVNGYPIKCSLQMEHSFGRYEAIPDQKDFVSRLIRFLTLSGKQRAERGYRARQGVLTHYTWEKTTSKWMDVFDSLEPKNLWDSPPRLHTPRNPPSSFASHEECVRWSIANVLGRPDLVNSYMALRLIRDLNWGVRVASTGGSYQNEECVLGTKNRHESFTPDDMVKELVLMCEESNRWERMRCQLSN